MHPPLGWSDLSQARGVGVWGLGVEGSANVRRLRAIGIEPVLVDDRVSTDGVVLSSEGGLDALSQCEVVVKSPGISRYREDVIELERAGVAVLGGLGLWLAEAPLERVICVTGTKGKSTTASIAGHLAKGFGVRCFVGGNIGLPPHDIDAPPDPDLWIIEVSSFQATDLAVSPPLVAVTSLHPDHLDWHGSVAAYYRDKLSLTSRPGAHMTIASAEDETLRAHESSLGPEVRWVDAEGTDEWASGLGLLGPHNRVNAAIAARVLAEIGIDEARDPTALRSAAAGFESLASRLQRIATFDEVDFVDDSLSTNVLPTIAAVDAFPGRAVAVLLGGFDRGIDYEPLAAHLAQRGDPTLALTLPANGARIGRALAQASSTVDIIECRDIQYAVARAFDWARPVQGVVLLSPAAPSFGVYQDFRARARAFTDAVAELIHKHEDPRPRDS